VWKKRLLDPLLRGIDMPPTLTMRPSRTLAAIFEHIRRHYGREDNTRKMIVGIVFARPECKISKDEILPHVAYFSIRSGRDIDFFFPGYVEASEDAASAQAIPVGDGKWMFDHELFDKARHDLERSTRWMYSGEADLLLANVRKVSEDMGYHADFTKVLEFDLDRMLKDKSIESVSNFFEQIFHFAEHHQADDPVGRFSDHMGLQIGKRSIVAGLWDRLKLLLGIDLRPLQDFAVRDVSR
jgi:hypothetical protein